LRLAPFTKVGQMFQTALAASQSQSAVAAQRIDLRSDLEIARLPRRRLAAKEHVFIAGDPRAYLYKLDSGVVCLYRVALSGRRQVTGFAFAGDIFGMGALTSHVLSAQALRISKIQSIPIAALTHLVGNDPRFGLKLYEAACLELASTQQTLLVIKRPALERLAGFLLVFAQRNGRNGEDPELLILPMTRADIGDFLGLTIETVSRMFSKLQAEGVIEIKQRGPIRVVDVGRLKELGSPEELVAQ
jgi:CRP/FNR family transcriptional regulator, anaerobic regulatory protein